MSNANSSRDSRLFVAAMVQTSPALDAVLTRLSAMGRAVRAVDGGQLHLTLKFYGNVAGEELPELAARLDALAAANAPFAWRLRGTGVFPSPQRPSIVWAAADDEGRFAAVAEALEQVSTPLGFSRERRAFTPHVTLARIRYRPPPALAELLNETGERDFGLQHTESLILMQSELGPHGALYTPLHTARFGEA